MKKILLLLFATLNLCFLNAQTMTFDSGASETGFSLSGWNSGGGAVFMSNLASPASISKNSGTWNFVSFDVRSFGSATSMRVTSNLGNTFDYNDGATTTHTLNWNGITTITFSRIGGGGTASDHDNIVYANGTLDIKTINEEQKITLYPNPATSKIKVRGLKNKKSYKIYNALGIVVVTGNITVNENINVNNFSKGVYFLQIDNKLTFPFIKS